MSINWPKHAGVYKDARDFRAKKRTELRKVIKALDDLRLGCAFTPAYQNILSIDRLLSDSKELMNQKNWGK